MATRICADASIAGRFIPAKTEMQVIDIHNHFFPHTWPDLCERYGTPDWPWIKHTGAGEAEIMIGDRCFRKIYAACWDPEVRLSEMDRDGIDVQVMSATPVLFAYDRPVEHALDSARMFNDAALEMCSRGNGRLKSLCQVPLQDPDQACKELSRCIKAGHLGVEIGNHVGERNLDDAGIVTFLHHCADEGAAVLVHPWDMFAPERTLKYMMGWTVGMPAETHLGIVAMILGGAFDKLPTSLRICFAHGGGSFAFLLGRLENAWQHHPVARGDCELPPSQYLKRFYVDSAVFDERTLQFLVAKMGADRVMLGSDYPFPLGEHPAGGLIRSSHLTPQVKARLLGENAAEFLGFETAKNPVLAEEERGAEQLTYSSYLHVPELLKLQHPQSVPPHHDELLFIIVHQAYELWFKELLHDLDAVVSNLRKAGMNPSSHDEIYEAARLLRRCTEITRVLIEQFTILETMLPTHFLAFRGTLQPASGFQSEQFRELEFLCGLKDEKMLRYHRPTPEAHALLERRLREPSLHDVFFGALQAMGRLDIDENSTENQRFQARARAVLALYRDERNNRDWIDVCERLTEFDELIVSWRLRHIQLVERTIGLRMGTGGTAGSSYLKLTLDKKFFPELWEARSLLTE
jgi:aminocarboxymuconate-semialdehyde decarboxylase